MADYRPVPDDDLETYRRMQDYAFSPEDGRRDYSGDDEPEPGLGERRGLYRDDHLLCIAGYHDFETRLRGEQVRVGGVSSVATPPEHRRGGLIRRLLREMLVEFGEEGIHLSALWPFEYGFYRQYGWDVVDRRTRYEFEPDALSFVGRTDPVGEFRPVVADDFEALDRVYDAFLAGYDLATHRDEAWWRNRIFERWSDDPYVYAWEADGEVRGYLTYTISQLDDRWSRKLSIHEFAYTDPVARRELVRFLHNHDSQVDRVELVVPEETTLLDQVDDPRAVECMVKPGPMFRLVDVTEAIEMLPVDEALGDGFTMAVCDPLLDRNDGTFEWSFEGGEATCRRADQRDGRADLSCDIGTLSQIYAGHLTPARAADLDKLPVRTPAALDALERAFPARDTYLPERF